jgi:uracil phosphoribosyltransferase
MPVHVINHPLVTHKMSILRDRTTSTSKFRKLVHELTMLLTYEATRGLPLSAVEIDTPVCRTTAHLLSPDEIVVAPILRAGLGMLEGMLELYPPAKVAHIGLRRNEETHLPETYYFNRPKSIEGTTVLVVDPMLATAGSLCAALDLLKEGRPARLIAICLIAAPEGRAKVEALHPDVEVYVGAMDERLNERAYIVPGLGDAGDRMFGTGG